MEKKKELLDANWNTVGTESISTRFVLLRTLIDEDTTQNDLPTTLQDLSSKSQGSRGEGGKEEGRRRNRYSIVIIN